MLGYSRSCLCQRWAMFRKELVAWRKFWIGYQQYRELARVDRRDLLPTLYPCLGDDTVETVIEPVLLPGCVDF